MSTLELKSATEHTSRKRPIEYPESDGKPVAESEAHITELLNCISVLGEFFWRRKDVYVAGNNFVFWNEGHPKDRLSPDTYVVFGVPKRVRNSYRSWEEHGKLPDVIFEFTSSATKLEDTHKKFLIYERVFRTSEYFLFDPTGKNLTPQLQGFRLIGDKYVRLELVGGKLFSERLGLELFSEGSRLTFIDPSTNVVLRRLHESNEYAKGQEQRADEERRIALAEKQRADEERRIALAERLRANDNEAIIQKLLAQLEERDRNDKTEDR